MEHTKYLFLKFKNAGFFRSAFASKDFVFDLNGKTKRKESVHYVEPITVHQISNALHVLMGERPAPSLRKTLLKRIDDIFDMANNGYLKINTIQIPNKKNGTFRYPEESITIRKAVYNSYSTAPETINWERVRRLLEYDLYNQFLSILNELFKENVRENYTCVDAVSKLREFHRNNEKVVDFVNLLDKKDKTPMIDFINGRQKPSKSNPNGAKPTFNMNDRTLITTNSAVDKITKLSGEIIIPINDFYLEKIRSNKGIATLMDGGLLWIEDVIDSDDMYESMLDGYTPINTISTEVKKITQPKTKNNEDNS